MCLGLARLFVLFLSHTNTNAFSYYLFNICIIFVSQSRLLCHNIWPRRLSDLGRFEQQTLCYPHRQRGSRLRCSNFLIGGWEIQLKGGKKYGSQIREIQLKAAKKYDSENQRTANLIWVGLNNRPYVIRTDRGKACYATLLELFDQGMRNTIKRSIEIWIIESEK